MLRPITSIRYANDGSFFLPLHDREKRLEVWLYFIDENFRNRNFVIFLTFWQQAIRGRVINKNAKAAAAFAFLSCLFLGTLSLYIQYILADKIRVGEILADLLLFDILFAVQGSEFFFKVAAF